MAQLKEAAEEKKARTKPVRLFNMAITNLENMITEDLLDSEVESAREKMLKAYSTVQELHQAYLVARQGSDSEEIEEDPVDTRWLEKHSKTRTDALEQYREWKQRKAASLVEEAAAGKIEELTR